MRNLISLSKEFEQAIMKDKEITAVLIFGSYARGEKYKDIDLCVILDKKYPNLKMSKKRVALLKYLSKDIDLHIFQQLPVYIRIRVIKDGKISLCKNEDSLYKIAFDTIKEFGLFENFYNAYLENVKNG
jgi:predicted nucleotidyltransferase